VRLIPRDEAFFDMFADLAQRLTDSAKLLGQVFTDPAGIDQNVAAIKTLEHEADQITHRVIQRIDQTFVTPFDREDIHTLATALDDVIDLLDGAARRVTMFGIREPREDARRLCEVLVRAATCLQEGVSNLKKSKLVSKTNREVKLLEEEADAIYQQAMAALFTGKPDPIEVIKWKEVYDKIEDAIDRCEDVANVLESIALKHA
jgi:uncharacterized protein